MELGLGKDLVEIKEEVERRETKERGQLKKAHGVPSARVTVITTPVSLPPDPCSPTGPTPVLRCCTLNTCVALMLLTVYMAGVQALMKRALSS